MVVCGCLAVAAGCRATSAPIDGLAAEYVAVARAIDGGDAVAPDTLAALRQRAANLDAGNERGAFLQAQLAALERRARVLAGERVSIREEAAALGLPVPTYDAERAAALRAELDGLLPGPGALPERLAAHRRARAISRATLDATAQRLIEDCRTRTPVSAGLLDAGIELRYVIDSPWPAFATYTGERRTRVAIRRDVLWDADELRWVLCHETYPGHHVQHLVWDDLWRERGWTEFVVTPAFTPHAVMAERAAAAATALAIPPESRPPVARALDALAPMALAVAIEIADATTDRQQGLVRLRDDLLMPDAAAFLAFVERWRGMAVAYTAPPVEIRDWPDYVALLRSPTALVAGAAR